MNQSSITNNSSKTTTTKQWLELLLSLKYIGNLGIYGLLLSYYTQAYTIFLILIPIVITNALVMLGLEWFNGDELAAAMVNTQDKNKFILLNTIWHILPLLWLWYILQRDNIIELFKPNFMGCYLAGVGFAIIYFYFASNGKYYGDIDYIKYMLMYVIVLLGCNLILY